MTIQIPETLTDEIISRSAIGNLRANIVTYLVRTDRQTQDCPFFRFITTTQTNIFFTPKTAPQHHRNAVPR